MTRTTALLALLALCATSSWAATWNDYEKAFPAFPCHDGWMACKVNGQTVSPDMAADANGMPTPPDLRIGWYDLQPTESFTPFSTLSAYTGEDPNAGVAAAPDPAPVAPDPVPVAAPVAPVPPPAPLIDPEEEARRAREKAEAEAARQAAAAQQRVEAERKAAEEKARREAEAAERKRQEEMARIEAERKAAMTAAADEASRKKAQEEAARREAELKKQQEAEEARRQAELKKQQEEAARKAREEEERRQKEAAEAARKAEEEARAKAEADRKRQEEEQRKAEEERQRQEAEAAAAAAAAAAKAKADADAAAMAAPKPAPATAAAADASCDDLVRLEPAAMLGKLNKGQEDCLEGSIATAARQTEKEKISLILMANAYSKGDKGKWEQLVKRHLDEIDQSNPDLCYKYALHLSRKGPSRAYGVIKWSDVALENRTIWTGDTYKSRVYSLYKLKAAAAQQLWQSSEEQHAAAPTEETKTKVEEHRNMTKVNAREWLEYARAAGKDTTKALQLCTSAAGTQDYCEGG